MSATDWRPSASWPVLRRRAELLARVRAFFAARGVLEVETPALAAAAVTDPHLDSVRCRVAGRELFLQTSPEYAMKRLLAAGSGPIYQLARAYREGESGGRHNPEFTMLEWYRPGFDHHRLMDEMDELLRSLLGAAPAERLTCGAAFARALGVGEEFPHRATAVEVLAVAARAGIDAVGLAPDDRDGWLELLASHVVDPTLGRGRPTFLHDFPVAQAALARIRQGVGGAPDVAERFEVYVEGVELANGFHELADAAEQHRRFAADRARRRERGLADVVPDERLLAALEHGLPECAGVALGFDRLVMLATGAARIDDVLAFPLARA